MTGLMHCLLVDCISELNQPSTIIAEYSVYSGDICCIVVLLVVCGWMQSIVSFYVVLITCCVLRVTAYY